jgi:hypothetical protein
MRVHLVSFLRSNHARTSHVETQGRTYQEAAAAGGLAMGAGGAAEPKMFW